MQLKHVNQNLNHLKICSEKGRICLRQTKKKRKVLYFYLTKCLMKIIKEETLIALHIWLGSY